MREFAGKSIYRWYGTLKRVLLYSLLGVGVLLFLFPVFWAFSTALRPQEEMFTFAPEMLPNTYTLANFEKVINETPLVDYFVNSIIISVGVITLTTVSATFAGYGLARIDIPYKKVFARGILFGYMFPAILLSIPMFIFWRELGIVDSYIGLIIAETAIALPFSIWLMWQFFQTVPTSLEESAQMAGASRFRVFYEIALPLAKPGIIGIMIFAFAVAWNQYTMPLILLPSQENWVLTIGLRTFVEGNTIQWELVTAASSLIILPPLLLIYFLQKYILSGFKIGGI